MPHVITRNYSKFWDAKADVQFDPVLDQDTGTFVGHAEVTGEQAEAYAGRSAFRVLDDASFAAFLSPAAFRQAVDAEADARSAKSAAGLDGAPPPPGSAADKAAAGN